jgi:hypothetical protein
MKSATSWVRLVIFVFASDRGGGGLGRIGAGEESVADTVLRGVGIAAFGEGAAGSGAVCARGFGSGEVRTHIRSVDHFF